MLEESLFIAYFSSSIDNCGLIIFLSGSFSLLNMSKNQVDEIGEQKENDAQCDGHVKVTPTRFHHGGCSQNA
jgi:hypothetical protein